MHAAVFNVFENVVFKLVSVYVWSVALGNKGLHFPFPNIKLY